MKALVALLLLLLADSAKAAVFKCMVRGAPVYQDRPCAQPAPAGETRNKPVPNAEAPRAAANALQDAASAAPERAGPAAPAVTETADEGPAPEPPQIVDLGGTRIRIASPPGFVRVERSHTEAWMNLAAQVGPAELAGIWAEPRQLPRVVYGLETDTKPLRILLAARLPDSEYRQMPRGFAEASQQERLRRGPALSTLRPLAELRRLVQDAGGELHLSGPAPIRDRELYATGSPTETGWQLRYDSQLLVHNHVLQLSVLLLNPQQRAEIDQAAILSDLWTRRVLGEHASREDAWTGVQSGLDQVRRLFAQDSRAQPVLWLIAALVLVSLSLRALGKKNAKPARAA